MFFNRIKYSFTAVGIFVTMAGIIVSLLLTGNPTSVENYTAQPHYENKSLKKQGTTQNMLSEPTIKINGKIKLKKENFRTQIYILK